MFSDSFLDAAFDCVFRNSDLPDDTLYFNDNGNMIALDKLFGDASHKTFYRFHYQQQSYVLMYIPKGIPSSEEIFCPPAEQYSQGEIFAQTVRWLQAYMIQVPTLYAIDSRYCSFIMTDAGDLTLHDYFHQQAQPNDERLKKYYFAAIDWLVELHLKGAQLPENSIMVQRHFNQQALLQELLEFIEYSPDERYTALAQQFEDIAASIAAHPQALIHRDYQSKNILLQPEDQLIIIDQQDMCMGSMYYDVASLLYDPYVNLSAEFINQCIHTFAERLHQTGLSQCSIAEIQQSIQLNGIQRLLKAAGRYQRIHQLKQNDAYLKYYDVAMARVNQLNLFQYNIRPLMNVHI